MRQPSKKHAFVVCKRTIASHQIATLLEKQGWTPILMANRPTLDRIEHSNPTLLIADIDDADLQGIKLLQYFRQYNPIAYTAALCTGGNSPSMQLARQAGVDGFIYLNASGKSLDAGRGLIPFFLNNPPSLAREAEARQWHFGEAAFAYMAAARY